MKSFPLLKIMAIHSASKIMMLFRKTILCASILVPSVSMGEIWFAGGYLSANLSLEGEYTTNANASSDAEADFITTVTPGISYRTEIAMLTLDAGVGYDFVRNQNLKENDSENLVLQFDTSFQDRSDSNFSIDDINLSVTETTDRNPEFGQTTRDRDYDASISVSYRVSALYSISSGIGYSRTEPLDGNRSETDSYNIPIDINYRHSETLSYGIGYRVNNEESSGEGSSQNQLSDISTTSHTLYGFVNGLISPLISGVLQLGAQMQQSDTADNSNSDDGEIAPYISGNLTWQISSATSCSLGVSTNFETTTGSQSSQGYSANVGLSHAFSTTMSGNMSLSFEQTELSSNSIISDQERTDNEWIFGAGLRKRLGRNTSLDLNLQYTENDSSEDSFSFDELSVSFGISQQF